MDQVADQKPRPSIPGPRIGGQENIIRENGDVTLNKQPAEEYVVDPRKMLQNSFDHFGFRTEQRGVQA